VKRAALLLLVATTAFAQPYELLDTEHTQHIIGDKSWEAVTFANLESAPHDGLVHPCTDCSATDPCTGGGTGAWALYVASHWVCSGGGTSTPITCTQDGGVIYNNAGLMTCDPDHYWDDTNDRLGVRTTSPLDVTDIRLPSASSVGYRVQASAANQSPGMQAVNSGATNSLQCSLNGSGTAGTSLTTQTSTGILTTDVSGGLNIVAAHASGPIKLATGGSATANERFEVLADGAFEGTGITTAGAPAVSLSNNGTFYYNKTDQCWKVSNNAGAYACVSTGSAVSGDVIGWRPAAACDNATFSSLWDLKASPNAATPACVAGTNIHSGILQFTNTSDVQSAYLTEHLGGSSFTSLNARILWYTSATTGSVVFQVATCCVADGEANDCTFNAASTVTDAAQGTASRRNTATITGVTVTGCAAGEDMYIKLTRDAAHGSDDLAATANVIGVYFTVQ
jgi:hypothetical protein